MSSSVDAPDAGLDAIPELLEGVRSSVDASQLRGESARALESYPDHAGLLLLRSIAEAMTRDPDHRTIQENTQACVRFAIRKYAVNPVTAYRAVISASRLLGDTRPRLARAVLKGLLIAAHDRRAAAREIIGSLPASLSINAVGVLVSGCSSALTGLLEG